MPGTSLLLLVRELSPTWQFVNVRKCFRASGCDSGKNYLGDMFILVSSESTQLFSHQITMARVGNSSTWEVEGGG